MTPHDTMTTFLHQPPSRYRNLISMSEHKWLLVEGGDDKRLFKVIQKELPKNQQEFLHVHSADDFVGDEVSGLGSRERVEHIAATISPRAYSDKFLGFVDREFREFELSDPLQDYLSGHKVTGRLVWSRGHSIENYFFDFSTLRQPLRIFSVTEYFDVALDLLANLLDSAITIACAASLAGKECDLLKLTKKSICWDILDIENESTIVINTEQWKDSFISKHHIQPENAKKLIQSYENWIPKIKRSNFEITRWLCHGHIGLATIWAAYGRCVLHACVQAGLQEPEKEVSHVLKAEESVRFNACADRWIQRILSKECADIPTEVLSFIGICPNV